MSDVRTSFMLDDLLLARADAVAQSRGLNRSEYLRDLIYKDLDEQPPHETEQLVHAQELGWFPEDPLRGAPRFFIYRSDGTFHTDTASSTDRLFESVEEYHRVRGGVGTQAAWEKYWRAHACQPVWVGHSTWHTAAWGEKEPDLSDAPQGHMIQYVNPYAAHPDNRTQIQVKAADGYEEVFADMIGLLKQTADTLRSVR